MKYRRPKVALTEEKTERYSKHLMLEQVGEPGQQKLLASKVLIIGAGGLGSPAALYLARSNYRTSTGKSFTTPPT